MDESEIKSLIDQLKAGGLEDDEIMHVFYQAFTKGKMDRKDLETLSNAMGYELTDEFRNDPTPDPISEGGDAPGEGESPTKEELEGAREIGPGESADEFKDKIEGMGEVGEGESEGEPEESGDADEDEPGETDGESESGETDETDGEDEDWEKAKKMFRI